MATAKDAGVLAAFMADQRANLPGVLGDAWRDGYTTAAAQLQPVIDRLQEELDDLHTRHGDLPAPRTVDQVISAACRVIDAQARAHRQHGGRA